MINRQTIEIAEQIDQELSREANRAIAEWNQYIRERQIQKNRQDAEAMKRKEQERFIE